MASNLPSAALRDLAVHPGSYIRDELSARRMPQAELARRMGRPVQVVNEIITEKKAVTSQTAIELETVLGVSAKTWLNLQSAYELAAAKQRKRETLGGKAGWAEQFPISEMAKRGWIAASREPAEKVEQILSFFGIASISAFQPVAAGGEYRLTAGAEVNEHALEAWLCRGEQLAEWMEMRDYEARQFRDTLPSIRALAADGLPDLAGIRDICAAAGVAFVVVDQIRGAGVSGATRRLRDDRPLIQLSLRYKKADIFWFTFFHEAAHVLAAKQAGPVIDFDIRAKRTHPDELAADEFAQQALIDPLSWTEFVESKRTSANAVRQFAAKVGLHPGIVVGRMQHERLIKRDQLNRLRVPLDPATLCGVF